MVKAGGSWRKGKGEEGKTDLFLFCGCSKSKGEVGEGERRRSEIQIFSRGGKGGTDERGKKKVFFAGFRPKRVKGPYPEGGGKRCSRRPDLLKKEEEI